MSGRLRVPLAWGLVVCSLAVGINAFPNTTTGHTLFAPFTLATTAEVPDTFLSFNFDVSGHKLLRTIKCPFIVFIDSETEFSSIYFSRAKLL